MRQVIAILISILVSISAPIVIANTSNNTKEIHEKLNGLKKRIVKEKYGENEVNIYLEMADLYKHLIKHENDPEKRYLYLNERTNILIRIKEYEKASADLEEMQRLKPNNIAPQVFLAEIREKQKMYREAINIYTSIVRSDHFVKYPQPQIYMYRARSFFHMKEYDASVKDLSEVLSIDSGSYEAYEMLGDISDKRGDAKVAFGYYLSARDNMKEMFGDMYKSENEVYGLSERTRLYGKLAKLSERYDTKNTEHYYDISIKEGRYAPVHCLNYLKYKISNNKGIKTNNVTNCIRILDGYPEYKNTKLYMEAKKLYMKKKGTKRKGD